MLCGLDHIGMWCFSCTKVACWNIKLFNIGIYAEKFQLKVISATCQVNQAVSNLTCTVFLLSILLAYRILIVFNRIVEIDSHQRVTLSKENGDVLKVKVPYEQIKPHLSSNIHKKVQPADQTECVEKVLYGDQAEGVEKVQHGEQVGGGENVQHHGGQAAGDEKTQHVEQAKYVEKVQHQNHEQAKKVQQGEQAGGGKKVQHHGGQAAGDEKTQNVERAKYVEKVQHDKQAKHVKKVQHGEYAGDDDGRTEIVIISEHKKKAKKRPIGPLPVQQAVLVTEISKLLPTIYSGEWLTDEHIDNAQAILAKHFPYIGGLQAVWVFISEGCQSLGTPEQEFIQIINVSGNHWITVSNIGNPKDTITIYDSLYADVSPSYKAKFLRQIAYMLMATSSHITLQWAEVQKQKGTSDCGLFAIAAATSLCYGVLPQYCSWEQEKMRDHLVTCFKRGDFTLFPQLPAAQGQKMYNRVEEVQVFCHCRQPYVENTFMAQCDSCSDWFHRGCQRIPRKITKTTPFVCKNCK